MITDIRDLDLAMKNRMKGIMIENEAGDTVEVPVFYLDPEPEFTPETYPTIVLYRIGIYPNNSLWTNDIFYDNAQYDTDGNLDSIDKREAPLPVSVYYGVRLYYAYQSDGTILTNSLLKKFRRGSYLPVSDEKYDVEFVSYKNPNSAYRTFGVIEGNKPREFIDQYLYKVDIEIDDALRETLKTNKFGVVTRINIIK